MEIDEIKFKIDKKLSVLNSILGNFHKAPNRTYNKKNPNRKKKQSA